ATGCDAALRLPFASQARHPISAASPPRQPRTSPMNIDLSDKTALVTGSTGGIGFAVARGLAACGARVAVNGRKQETVDAALARIREALPKAKLIGVAADVSTAEGCAK